MGFSDLTICDLEKTLAQYSGELPHEIIGALGFAEYLKRRKNMDSWATTWAIYGYSSAVKLGKDMRDAVTFRIAVRMMANEDIGFSVLVYGDDLVLGITNDDEDFLPIYISYNGSTVWEEERAEEAKAAFVFGFVYAIDVLESLPYVDFTKLMKSVIKKLDDLEQ